MHPAAEYTHRDGNCSFDVLVEEFKLTTDPGLVRLAEIVHAADVSEDIDASPEGRGLSAIAHGFALLHGTEDHKKIELETPMYDALYAVVPGRGCVLLGAAVRGSAEMQSAL